MAYDLIKISALPAATPDESQEIVVGVGDYAKRINYGDVKNDMVGTSPSYTTDTEPYLMRQTANIGVVGKCALEKLVGGSLGWNQILSQSGLSGGTVSGITLVKNSNGSVTLTGARTGENVNFNVDYVANTIKYQTGHVYYLPWSGVNGIGLQIIMDSDVGADSLNKNRLIKVAATASTRSWARIRIGTPMNANIGTVTYFPQILDITQMFGAKIADHAANLENTYGTGIAWLSKYIDLSTYHAYDAGSIQSVQATAHVTTGKNQYTQGNAQGAIYGSGSENSATTRCKTDGYIPVVANQKYTIKTFTTGIYVIGYAFYDRQQTFIQTVVPSSNTNYTNTFTSLSNASYVRFTFWKQNNNITPNEIGNVQLELGETATAYESPVIHTYPLGSDTLRGIPQLVNNELQYDGDVKTADGTITRKYGIRAYQSGDVSDGSTMLTDGTNTVYKLATPTTETSTPYQRIQTVDADGTESFTTSTPVPVGHETATPDNILAALEWIGE